MTSILMRPRRPIALILCLIAAGIGALSVHVGMLSAGVPYPQPKPPRWAGWLNISGSAIGLLIALRLAQERIGEGFWRSAGLGFLILATIRETLRGTIMNGVVTTAWAFAFIGLPDFLVRVALIALPCALLLRWTRSCVTVGIAGLAVGAFALWMGGVATAALAPLSEHFAYLGLDEVYKFPYPAVVQIPAYLTFAEPVVGATLLASLIWDRLPGGVIPRAIAFALLIAMLKGVLVATLLFSFFMVVPPLAGMLSYSQFLFEFLALGLLVGLSWERFGRPAS